MGRIYRYLPRRLKAKVLLSNPRDYVSKYVSQLSLCGDTENIALDILDYAKELGLTNGRGPTARADG
jgi:transcription initiation factor TFIIIB Brf1 subunit/transcription initiation factor TFIIB